MIPTDTKFVRYCLALFRIGKYCLVLVSIVKVFSGIARYCFVFPGIAPAEEKKNIMENYQQQ